MWAVGCVAFELFTGRPPFYNEDENVTTINLVNCRYELQSITDDKLRNFISKLLQKKPKNRLNYKQALEHSFFAEQNWSQDPQKTYIMILNNGFIIYLSLEVDY